MTSDQRTSGSGRGYIEQCHLLQEGIDYDPVVVRGTYARTSRDSGGDGGYAYQTTSCAALCAMARSEEEDDTAAVDAADAERASSMMRKWDLPPRLLCVYRIGQHG